MMSTIVRGYPTTSDRGRGWLRYLFRKATTPDNWEKDGTPHPHWDGISNEPTLSWHRFDLIDSCYAVALMADQTPAWRVVDGDLELTTTVGPHTILIAHGRGSATAT